MIEVRGLTKVYEDPDGGEVPAVRDATLTCRAGEIYGLLGPNGAGKTTTLRCLATVLTPTAGTATIAGHDLIKDPQAVRHSIGWLSANTGLYARLTPRETLRFFGGLHGMTGDALEARVHECIRLFDITNYADRPNDRLSTGMKQRVGLARAVVHDPPVLILDEPTTGLDPIVSRTVENAVKSLAAAGKCVLFSTHLLDQAEELCSRIGIIGGGQVLGEGTIEELCERTGTHNLRGAFFGMVDRALREVLGVVPDDAEAPSPSPGTPGEGGGEGSRDRATFDEGARAARNPHPTLSRRTGRGEDGASSAESEGRDAV